MVFSVTVSVKFDPFLVYIFHLEFSFLLSIAEFAGFISLFSERFFFFVKLSAQMLRFEM